MHIYQALYLRVIRSEALKYDAIGTIGQLELEV